MATSALEEKINKIKLQNEEIKRRYEEVEADKKNAAQSNALVQMVPSSDWPERKEPLEFTRKETTKSNSKSKTVKEHSERSQQYLIGGAEGKKTHKFSQGDGPPPDPKYNFLADSEREENNLEGERDEEKPKGSIKRMRNGPRKRGGGRDGYQKDHRGNSSVSRDRPLLEYDAWRAERNRIDEARISRQRTAEGNWRREWDSDKTSMEKDSSKKDLRFLSNDTNRRDHQEFERQHQLDGQFYPNRSRRGSHHISYRPKNTRRHYDNQYPDHSNEYSKVPVTDLLLPVDDRTVTATDKSIKVTLNQGATPIKRSVMSVKVNAPSIAGTGRVGPRQKTRVTYSSQSEVEVTTHRTDNFLRQKSFDEKVLFNNVQRTSAPKSPYAPRKKESDTKSPYPQRKDTRRDEQSIRSEKRGENISKFSDLQKKDFKDIQKAPQLQARSHTTISCISPRAQVQNRLNKAKSTVLKNLAQSSGSNEGATKKSAETSTDKGIEVRNDKIIQESNFLEKNSQNEITTSNKDIVKKQREKIDVENANIEPVNVEFSEIFSEKLIENESTDLLKLEKNESEKSNDISFNIKAIESESKLLNRICKKIGTENEVNSEISNEETNDLAKNQSFEIEEAAKGTQASEESSENETVNSKAILSSETEKITQNSEKVKNSFVKNENESVEISKDALKEKLDQIEILEKNQCLNIKKMDSLDKNLEEVKKKEISESFEIINSDKEREHLIENLSKVESNKLESEDNSQIVSEMKIDEIVKEDKLKNSCEGFLIETKLSSIESQSENLTAE